MGEIRSLDQGGMALSVKVQGLLAVHCGPRPVASGHEVSWFVKKFGLRNLRTTSNGEAIRADCNLEIPVLLQLEEGCRQMGLEPGSQYPSCELR